MAKKEDYSQGGVTITEIWVDRETGVQYLFHRDGYGGGLTPLRQTRDGKTVRDYGQTVQHPAFV